jgi:hypothetical protein
MSFCVYVYFNPTSNQPIYVGEGSIKRARSHWVKVRGGRRAQNWMFTEELMKIKNLGLQPRIEIINLETKQQAIDLEKTMISKYGRRGVDAGGILCNRMPSGYIHNMPRGPRPLVVRQKIAAAHLGKPKPKHTSDHNHKISQALTGRVFSDTHKANLSKSLVGKTKKSNGRCIFTIKAPDGSIYKSNQLGKFCEEHGLNRKSLYNSLEFNRPIMAGCNKGWQLISSLSCLK